MGLRAKKLLILTLLIFVILMIVSCGTAQKESNVEKPQDNKETTEEKGLSEGIASDNSLDVKNNGKKQNPLAAKYQNLIKKSQSIDSYYCEVIMTSKMAGNTVKIPSKMWVKGNKMKVEQEMGPALTSLNYWDLDQGIMYTYKEESKTATKMEVPATNGLNQKLDSLDLDDENITDKGRTTIDGKTCLVFEYKSGSTRSILYVSEENGLPFKSEVFQDDELKMEMVYRNYEIGKVTEEMVNLPEGTEVSEI